MRSPELMLLVPEYPVPTASEGTVPSPANNKQQQVARYQTNPLWLLPFVCLISSQQMMQRLGIFYMHAECHGSLWKAISAHRVKVSD
jgi:hypothetical protein